jgi:hypothetical protein
MAMISCSECGASVSTEAKNCPACGASRKVFRRSRSTRKSISWPKKIGIAFGAVFGLGFIGAVVEQQRSDASGGNTASDEAIANLDARRQVDDDFVDKAQTVIQQSLKDPSSAEFSHGFARIKKGQQVACGYVNAKNSFGAMAGASQWIVLPHRGIAMVRGYDDNSKFIGLWNAYCTGLDDRDKPIAAQMFGIQFGSRQSSNLKPYEGSRGNVLVYSRGKPSEYLGVHLQDAWFEAQHGRIFGGSATAHGADAYDKWRAFLLGSYGAPTSVGFGDRGILEWKRKVGAEAQLSYNPNTDQALLNIGNSNS